MKVNLEHGAHKSIADRSDIAPWRLDSRLYERPEFKNTEHADIKISSIVDLISQDASLLSEEIYLLDVNYFSA